MYAWILLSTVDKSGYYDSAINAVYYINDDLRAAREPSLPRATEVNF